MNEQVKTMELQDFVDILEQPGVIETAELQRGGLKCVLLCRDCSDINLINEFKSKGYTVIVDRCQNCRNELDGSSVPAIRDVLLYYNLIEE